MDAHILIVEDEIKIARLLADYLQAEGATCHLLQRGDEVAGWLALHRADLILLDLMLPGRSGLDLCRDIRSDSMIPIIMITARVDEIDRLLGLELGADDYICKPFSPREVVARCKAVLRRLQVQRTSSSLRVGQLHLDPASRQAFIGAQSLNLTALEFDMLQVFAEQPHAVHSRRRLLARAKGSDYAGYERNIDTHMKNLRRKLRGALGDADPFDTIYGLGYRLNAAALAGD